jgi:hypothetical protein
MSKYVEKDLQEMKVKRWRQAAGDGEERTSVIRAAKAVRGRRAEE